MHELSIAMAVVDTATRHARGRPVTAVTLRVGRLRQVVPDSLDFSWGLVTRGTICEGARLEQQVVAARLRCGLCGREWEVTEPDFRCPACRAAGEVADGDQLEVESIEVEEVACTAPG